MYVKVEDDIARIYSISNIYTDNPNVSFPSEIPDDTLAEYGIFPAILDNKPSFDEMTYYAKMDTPKLVDSKWVIPWIIEALPIEQASGNIRFHRNQLLVSSDWTQVSDSPVDKIAWAAYRQSLRDITEQSGFPYNVTWPTKPQG